MIVTFTVPARPDYASADIVARRLAREELIKTAPYLVEPGHEFGSCLYCAEPQGPAVFVWSWRRWSGRSVVVRASCTDWSCVRAVLELAELDGPPGGITCEYPVCAGHDTGTALAA
jgi:hypothetical protein